MNHINDLDNLTRMTRRREFEDGLMDFVFGIVFLGVGTLSWVTFSEVGMRLFIRALLWNREITIIVLLTLIALSFLVIYGARRVIERIRRSVLWKERGFVKSLRWQVSWQTNLLAGGVAIVIILAAFWLMTRGAISQEATLRALVCAAGVATGIVFMGVGKELRLRRYEWVGLVGSVFSAAILIIPISFSQAWLLLGVLWMVVLTLSGSWALRGSLATLEESKRG